MDGVVAGMMGLYGSRGIELMVVTLRSACDCEIVWKPHGYATSKNTKTLGCQNVTTNSILVKLFFQGGAFAFGTENSSLQSSLNSM